LQVDQWTRGLTRDGRWELGKGDTTGNERFTGASGGVGSQPSPQGLEPCGPRGTESREEGEDRLGGLEELEGSPVSETAGPPPTADSNTADYLAAEPDRLAGSAQLHLAAYAGPKGRRRRMFDEEPYRADVQCLEEGDLAETHIQACRGPDALRAPALPARRRRNVGGDGEPSQLDFGRRNGGVRSRGLGTRALLRALAHDREVSDTTPRAVGRGAGSLPYEIVTESANPVGHRCSALHPKKIPIATLNGGRGSCRPSGDSGSTSKIGARPAWSRCCLNSSFHPAHPARCGMYKLSPRLLYLYTGHRVVSK